MKMLEKLNGMFSFAILDKKKKKIIIVRDRLGIKPLYYYIDEDKFIFASEIKVILKYAYFEKKINFNYKNIEDMFKKHKKGMFDYSTKIWALFCLELWHNNFIDKR